MRPAARAAVTVAGTALVVAGLAAPAAAEAKGGEVIVAECGDRTLELRRSNGSSFWGVREDGRPGAHYALVSLSVFHEGSEVFAKEWGNRTGFDARLTCTGQADWGFVWEMVVAADDR